VSLLFPSLVGQGWSVHKKPKFDTRVAAHATGREARAGKYLYPMWDFELTFDALDMTATGTYGGLGAQSMQTLAGFFLQCQGKANPFVYVDPTDNTVDNATIGVGDGVTTAFTCMRPMGEYSEPVGALISLSAVRMNGANIFGWVAQQPNQLVFGTPPPPGAVITASFKFGYACRFTEDVEDFEEFMAMLTGVKTLAFQSVRDVVPFEITALRVIVIQPSDFLTEFCAPHDWNNDYNRVIAIGGGGGGGYTPGVGGGGGAFTYRDNVQLAVGECVPIVAGAGGPPHEQGSDWGLPGVPTSFHNKGDPNYVYADAAGTHAVGFAGASWGGLASWCVPPENAHGGGDGMTVQAFAGGCNGGGGAGGPFGDGGSGGSCYTHGTQSGAGGGGADGGATAEDPPAADYKIGLIVDGFNVPTAGGAARDGTPGGAPGPIDTRPATGVNGPGSPGKNGSGGGGGGGGLGGVNGPDGKAMYGYGDGGDGSTEPLWFLDGVWYGPGSGGGGAGGALSFFDGGFAGRGGNGGKFGGGGGGGGGTIDPGVGGDGGKVAGKGGDGGLIIIYLGVETSSG